MLEEVIIITIIIIIIVIFIIIIVIIILHCTGQGKKRNMGGHVVWLEGPAEEVVFVITIININAILIIIIIINAILTIVIELAIAISTVKILFSG